MIIYSYNCLLMIACYGTATKLILQHKSTLYKIMIKRMNIFGHVSLNIRAFLFSLFLYSFEHVYNILMFALNINTTIHISNIAVDVISRHWHKQ